MSQKDIEKIFKYKNRKYNVLYSFGAFYLRKIEVSDSSKPIIIYDLCL